MVAFTLLRAAPLKAMAKILMAESMQVGSVMFNPGEIVSFDKEADEIIVRGAGYFMAEKVMVPKAIKVVRRYVRKQSTTQSSCDIEDIDVASPLEDR